MLLCRCGTSAFKSSSSDWKRKAATDAHTLNEYAELFGSGEAATTETAGAGAIENGGSHAAPDANPGADDNVVMTGEHTGYEGHAAAASTQLAATEKEKKKKKKNKQQKNAVHVESPAPVKKKKKTSKKKANDISMLDLDNAEAPWANEPGIAAQPDDVEQAEGPKMETQGKSQQTGGISTAHAPLNTGQALALLGFAAAKPLSQHKKQKKRDC